MGFDTSTRCAKRQAPPIPARVAERAAKKYVVEGECWISTYSVASHGYAQVGWKDGKVYGTTAHRAAFTHHAGRPIGEGMTVDHTCKQRRCVNPAHLREVPNFENARRTSGRDWEMGQCANGHSNEHLTMTNGGRRVRCGICNAEQQRRYREKKRAEKAMNTRSSPRM